MAKVLIGNFIGPQGPKGDKGDKGEGFLTYVEEDLVEGTITIRPEVSTEVEGPLNINGATSVTGNLSASGNISSSANITGNKVEATNDVVANKGTANEVSLSTLNDEKDNILSQLNEMRNFRYQTVDIPANNVSVHSCYIPMGCKFTMKTVDGSKFSATTRLRLIDKNGTDFDYYTIFSNISSRTVTWNGSKDIYGVKMESPLTNAIKVVIELSKVEEIVDKTEKMISDAYSSSTTYSNGDFCIYQNKLWKSKVNTNIGNVPVEGSYWTETRVGSEIKALWNAING